VNEPLLTPIELLGAEAIAIHRFLSQHPGKVFTANAIAQEIEVATAGKLQINRKRVYRTVEKLQGVGVEIEVFKGRSGDRQQGFCITQGQSKNDSKSNNL
jgi:biotin operon repressor